MPFPFIFAPPLINYHTFSVIFVCCTAEAPLFTAVHCVETDTCEDNSYLETDTHGDNSYLKTDTCDDNSYRDTDTCWDDSYCDV